MYPPHPKMLKLTVFQGSPSLTKQPNWALMENNPEKAILNLSHKISWKRAETRDRKSSIYVYVSIQIFLWGVGGGDFHQEYRTYDHHTVS